VAISDPATAHFTAHKKPRKHKNCIQTKAHAHPHTPWNTRSQKNPGGNYWHSYSQTTTRKGRQNTNINTHKHTIGLCVIVCLCVFWLVGLTVKKVTEKLYYLHNECFTVSTHILIMLVQWSQEWWNGHAWGKGEVYIKLWLENSSWRNHLRGLVVDGKIF
jgi:hypothetical protein